MRARRILLGVVVGALLGAVSFGAAGKVAAGKVKEFTAVVDGPFCEKCVTKLDSRFKRLPEVGKVVCRLDAKRRQAVLALELKPNRHLSWKTVRRVVADAGFSIRELRVMLAGQMHLIDKQYVFIEGTTKERYVVAENDQAGLLCICEDYVVRGKLAFTPLGETPHIEIEEFWLPQ